MALEFNRLELLFRRAGSLPPLPATAMQLLELIDGGRASALELERIIVSDPHLPAELLRVAALSRHATEESQFSSVRGAIMLLGQRAVRSMAASLLLKEMTHHPLSARSFQPERFARHSLTIGLLSKYLFLRRTREGDLKSKWSGEEIFAAGLLKDLAFGLFARTCATDYDRLNAYCAKTRVSLEDGFKKIYGEPAVKLAHAAATSWNLPHVFVETFEYLGGLSNPAEDVPALKCIADADVLARLGQLRMETWECAPQAESEEDLLPAAERAAVLTAVTSQVDDYMRSATSEAA